MARVRSPELQYPTPRLKLARRKRPYWVRISRGVKLGYRRAAGAGTWTVKVSGKLAGGTEWIRVFATADDHEPADGGRVMSYPQAVDRALALARPDQPASGRGAPVSVGGAIDEYEKDLRARGAHPGNARVLRGHVPDSLASKCVGLLDAKELKTWRDGLLDGGMKPATVNRVRTMLRAALNLAADHDSRIINRSAWKVGLKGLPDAEEARHVVLSDDEVLRIVAAAYEESAPLGLLLEVLAQTGARTSQVRRLLVEDLQADWREGPRLMMPDSFKGGPGGRKVVTKTPIPISPTLAAKLKAAAAGRLTDARLLLCVDGEPWRLHRHRKPFRNAVARAGLDTAHVIPYALRHSSIVRQLQRLVPVVLVAKSHDTSETMVSKHYAAFIVHHSDALVRNALLETAMPAVGATVVPIRR
jgi:integrase